MAGSGAIACGIAAVAARGGPVVLWARSEASAQKATDRVGKLIERCGWGGAENLETTTDVARLCERTTFVVEAIVEERAAKAALMADLRESLSSTAVLATTTSSLSVEDLASESGQAERFVGLHVFNPVTKMDLVELVFPAAASQSTRERAFALCEALGKTAVEVPDLPGFVVNRLLFPYLFDAVRLLDEIGLSPAEVDDCMSLGAGQPMGPLRLLDFIGVDVAVAIGESLHEASGSEAHAPPERLVEMAAAGHLGRKSGEGFYRY